MINSWILSSDQPQSILNYKFINIDAIVIEILPKDKINENYYFLPDLENIKDYNKFKNKRINIIEYKLLSILDILIFLLSYLNIYIHID